MANGGKQKNMRYLRKCKCCLEEENLKDLWSEHIHEGQTEVYGDMITECYSLPWEEPNQNNEYICELCIERLRYSLEFRREIMTAQELWSDLIAKEMENKLPKEEQSAEELDEGTLKEEQLEYETVDSEGEEGQADEFQMTEGTGGEDTGDEEQEQYLECASSQDGEGEGAGEGEGGHSDDDMQVEYLEEESDAESEAPKRKRGRGYKSSYKKYTAADLGAAVESVLGGSRSRSEAASLFNIPVKTLSAKIRAREMQDEEGVAKNAELKKLQEFYEEIRVVLTYTNATPYKTKIGKFFCAYCGSVGPIFRNPDHLRTHTRTKHANERLKSVDKFMRPVYLNEVLKLDIHNLQCTVCMAKLDDWNMMFQHVLDAHDVTLDQAYTRVVPYVLTEELQCALCTEKFSHFHTLDCHMNCHYNNYICGECGDTFITETRLKKHVETHSNEQFPCSECGKVFALEKYRRKHLNFVHKRLMKFRCHYCKEVFTGEYQRHLHEVEKHLEAVKKIKCEYCFATFTWRPYYLKHVRLMHKRPEKKHECKLCSKRFMQKHELKNHLDWHRGEGFTCDLCDRKFSTRNYLQKHLAAKHQDGRTTPGIYVIVNEDENAVETVENIYEISVTQERG